MAVPRATVSVAFALEAEFAPWRSLRTFTPALPGGAFEARLGSIAVRAAIVGIGARRLDRVAPWLLDDSVGSVIVAGLAGALSPDHQVGDVLVAREVSRGRQRRTADPHLLAVAARCGAAIVERFLTVDHIAATASAKRALAAAGDGVDMESFDIIDAAQRRGIAALAVRVVGDSASDDLPIDVEPAITADGALAPLPLVGQIAVRPWTWPGLIRFALAQRRALGALSIVLDALTGSIGPLL